MSGELCQEVVGGFRAHFGREPAVTASAPGRVNLIGEHTDYNGGFVLPTAIPQRAHVALAPRGDARVRVASANVPGGVASYALGTETPGRGWLDYVQGVTQALRAAGHAVGGFEAYVASTVPLGSGLASSAALEVALLRALRAAFGLPLDDVALAHCGQRAENEFVGARVGIMDQLAASLAEPGSALFLDTRSLAHERVPLSAAVDLVVIDSGVKHAHAAGAYNARRAECERTCALLGVVELRDVGTADLARIAALPDPLDRRARHVVTENARVLAAVDALRAGDLPRLGALFAASHASLRDDYEVSVPEVDQLVALAAREPTVYGARLTGGGFGGAVVVLARAGAGAGVAARLAAAYAAAAGRTATILLPPPS
ncbi:MAG TPA: galactokinase [Chloroflexota bacterium]|nr:galactokinase [Chloroflexota bacterium]